MTHGCNQKIITADDMELLTRIQACNPILYDRVMGILNIVHDSRGRTADDVEFQVIDNLRDLGKDLLTTWATEQVAVETAKALEQHSELKRSKKKELSWQTTYGEITVEEQILSDKNTQEIVRPFKKLAAVECRGYSLPLQRAMTDFGVDESFGAAAKKLKEHYGIDVSITAIQRITENHAEIVHNTEEELHKESLMKPKNATGTIIAEIDGSMVPIVERILPNDVVASEVDLRKFRTLLYKEARLAIAHEQGSATPVFAATMGGVAEAGKQLRFAVEDVGLNDKTKIHGVGDGATWIASQFENQFGAQSTYLIDFYHLCDYLSAASKSIPHSERWMEQQKILLKNSQSAQVLLNLKPYIEPSDANDENAAVRACYRYIDNRPSQFDYKDALENELPIGSGEVESEHRYISQKRLKLPGAWWKASNAENMLSLRVQRANGGWNDYWDKKRKFVA